MSKKSRKDSRKAKRAMTEKETKKENITQEEPATEEAETANPDDLETSAEEQPAEEQTAEEISDGLDKTQEEAVDSEETEQPGETEETEEAAAGTSGDEKPKKERKLKWARSNSEKKPDPLEEKVKEVNDRYARLFAEFDNFRKRSDKEKTQRYDFGVKDTVEKILPIIDNFERGLAAVPQEQAEDSFVTGMQMIYKQLMKALEDMGVKPIEAVGQEFNPDFHNAVMHVDDPEAGDNIIVEEFQKGYMYKDHVVRYSMVKVAN